MPYEAGSVPSVTHSSVCLNRNRTPSSPMGSVVQSDHPSFSLRELFFQLDEVSTRVDVVLVTLVAQRRTSSGCTAGLEASPLSRYTWQVRDWIDLSPKFH